MNNGITINIAGAAGQGMQTIGFLLSKIIIRSGLHVFAVQDNESRIRGGQNFFSIRVSKKPVMAMTKSFDLLVALNQHALNAHQNQLSDKTVVIVDTAVVPSGAFRGCLCDVPLQQIALESGGDEIYSNAVALGAIVAITRGSRDVMEATLRDYFSQKEKVAVANCSAANAGFDYVLKHHPAFSLPLTSSSDETRKMFISGHEAIALGALAAGCQFYAAYPMSPATSILTYLAGKTNDFSLVVEQPEDEIAAINMAIGASCIGVRSMTATSGGGFSLMVESLGLTGVAEIPLVVIESQRPGPATGLATRTEQADLRFVIHAAQGEFPRVVMAPGTAREAFYLTIKAFHIAEEYQIPVIILTDQYLADSYFTEERFTLDQIIKKRYFSKAVLPDSSGALLRYGFTETGISPRYPITGEHKEMMYDSHEHTESGHITEDAGIRTRMVEKRFKKMEGVFSKVDSPVIEGAQDASLLLVGWGSTYGVLHEVTAGLNREGVPVRLMHIQELWPFPLKAALAELSQAQKWVVVENNYTSQLSGLIREKTCLQPSGTILKYDGRPFYYDELRDQVMKEVKR
jgi:2-oxoglutarate ferredoxin oxidoreductase subunit alpha